MSARLATQIDQRLGREIDGEILEAVLAASAAVDTISKGMYVAILFGAIVGRLASYLTGISPLALTAVGGALAAMVWLFERDRTIREDPSSPGGLWVVLGVSAAEIFVVQRSLFMLVPEKIAWRARLSDVESVRVTAAKGGMVELHIDAGDGVALELTKQRARALVAQLPTALRPHDQ